MALTPRDRADASKVFIDVGCQTFVPMTLPDALKFIDFIEARLTEYELDEDVCSRSDLVCRAGAHSATQTKLFSSAPSSLAHSRG